MKAPLSPNELEILDRQVAMINTEMVEIAKLLISRLGESNELARSAASIQEELATLVHRIHRQTLIAGAAGRVAEKSQSA